MAEENIVEIIYQANTSEDIEDSVRYNKLKACYVLD
jgi:hypothetical protein